ncbi:MAG TPA: dihydroorotase, partial [Clostridiales bacterium]|nr:dihydroorotase [Clostridiales bacterium]
MQLLIQGGRVVDPANGVDTLADVLLQDGRIAQIGENLPCPAQCTVLRAEGLVVAPGLVDLHV